MEWDGDAVVVVVVGGAVVGGGAVVVAAGVVEGDEVGGGMDDGDGLEVAVVGRVGGIERPPLDEPLV